MQNPSAAEDTTADVRSRLIRGWRAMTPARKAALVDAWSRDVTALAIVGLRRRHPGAADEEIRFRLACLLLGDSLAEQVIQHSRTRPR